MSLEAYLQEKWLKDALDNGLEPTKPQKQALAELFKSGKVWLLLDGVDEMKTANSPLSEIQQSLRGWVKQARVVISCRLNVWEANPNTLQEFDTYRTLCFEAEGVNEFIRQWFEAAEAVELGIQLQQQLAATEHTRLLDLVKNPLRLSLLCKSWKLNPNQLPTTQAMLYQQFRDDFYVWKQDEFPTSWSQRQELNAGLARLALRAIDENLPLRKSLVYEVLGEAQFELAERLGWLNFVYRDVRTDEPIFAFFHLTFQEYFAACGVADWGYFLPRNHDGNNPDFSHPYRIFEKRWREAILLWLGRGDVSDEEKEGFIQALVNFEDGCGKWHYGQVNRGFYEYSAYFLAANGLTQYKSKVREKIVENIVIWSFGRFISEEIPYVWLGFLSPIQLGAKEVISKTDTQIITQYLSEILEVLSNYRNWLIALLEFYSILMGFSTMSWGNSNIKNIENLLTNVCKHLAQANPNNSQSLNVLRYLIVNTQNESIRLQAAESLGQINPGSPEAIAALIDLSNNAQNEYTLYRAVWSLEQIGQGYPEAVAALIDLSNNAQNEFTRSNAVKSLGQLGQGYPEAVAALIDLSNNAQDEFTRSHAVESLGQIGQGYPEAVAALIDLSNNAQDEFTRSNAVKSLGQINPNNPEAIAALYDLMANAQDESIRLYAAQSLGRINPNNPEAIVALEHLMANAQDKDIRRQAAQSLGQINPNNPEAIAALCDLAVNAESESTRLQAALSLGNINPNNPEAIAAICDLIAKAQENSTRLYAALSLGQIGQGNPQAIAALCDIMAKTQDKYTCREAAWTLGEIGQGNFQAIAALCELMAKTQDKDTRRQVAENLKKIVATDEQRLAVVSTLRPHLNNETYENNFNLYENCYTVIWKIAQDLSYTDFYQAWHKTTQQSLENQLLNLPQQLQTHEATLLLCLDIHSLLTTADPIEIADFLWQKIHETAFPEATELPPEISRSSQLTRYLKQLTLDCNKTRLVLILHDSIPPQNSFSPSLRDVLIQCSDTALIAWLTDSPLDPPLKGFPPTQGNLVAALQSWLDEV